MDNAQTKFTADGARWGIAARGLALACLLAATSLSTEGARADSLSPRDFEGYWVLKTEGGATPPPSAASPPQLMSLPYKEETRSTVERHVRLAQEQKPVVDAHLGCRPPGATEVLNAPAGAVVIQTTTRLVLLNQEERGTWNVFVGQPHLAQVKPTYMGESVARWDGDTLVVDSIGYNGRAGVSQPMMATSSPLSQNAHIVTRISKSSDDKTLSFVSTYTDPENYTAPFEVTKKLERKEEHRLTDYDCAETPRADEFSRWTYEDDWYRPTCVFPVMDGLMADKIVCAPPDRRR